MMLVHILWALAMLVLFLPMVCMVSNIINFKYTWHRWCVMCQIEKHIFRIDRKP